MYYVFMYGITFVSIACKDWKVSISYVLILTFIDRAKRGQEILKINPFHREFDLPDFDLAASK